MGVSERLDEMQFIRTQLTSCFDNMFSLDNQVDTRAFLSEYRKIPLSSIEDAKIIYSYSPAYISDNVDASLSDYFGFTYNDENIFRERFIIPIFDMSGKIQGMSGYDSDSTIKYLFTNTTFFSKSTSFYNMQHLESIFNHNYLILVEGFFDSIRLNSLGLFDNLAMMGTRMEPYHVRLLNRIPLKIIIGDNDTAGVKAQVYWKTKLKGKIAIVHIKERYIMENRLVVDDDGNESTVEVETLTKDVDALIRLLPDMASELLKLISRIRKDADHPFYTYKEYWI